MAGSRTNSRRKGGFLGNIVNTAIVPGTLLALQQTYRRGNKHVKTGGKRSKRRGRGRKAKRGTRRH